MVDTDWLPRLDSRRCTACGLCIAECPTGALGWQHDRAALLWPERCTYCAACETLCPSDAIELPYLIVKCLP
jgi:NAD-dependent dihydropyrimidine dehydrogenase PreA subunit